jgi:hypothetical protein
MLLVRARTEAKHVGREERKGGNPKYASEVGKDVKV